MVARAPAAAQDAAPEVQKAYSELEQARLKELWRRFPGDPETIYDRWLALTRSDLSWPMEERRAIIDALFALRRRSPDSGWTIQAADYYVKWHVRLEQVPGLVLAGLREQEREGKYALDPTMFPEPSRKNTSVANGSFVRRAWRRSKAITAKPCRCFRRISEVCRAACWPTPRPRPHPNSPYS